MTRQGTLPDDFPGKVALAEADITTFAQVRNANDLTEIRGIGAATAQRITEALADAEKTEGSDSAAEAKGNGTVKVYFPKGATHSMHAREGSDEAERIDIDPETGIAEVDSEMAGDLVSKGVATAVPQ